jgi:hypothetical protein
MASNHNDDEHIAANEAPGTAIRRVLDANHIAREVARHIHLEQIIDDHFVLWAQAETIEARLAVHKRFRKQVARALVSFGGIEIAAHGVISVAFGNWLVGASLIVVGAALIYLTKG